MQPTTNNNELRSIFPYRVHKQLKYSLLKYLQEFKVVYQ